jgi:hypothetical protein
MESSRFALTVLVLLALPAISLGLREVSPVDRTNEHHRLETTRLRAHFDSVGLELRAPMARPLTSAQRESRATVIAWLRDYREAGSFPRNDRFHDGAMPFFRDSRGVLCAMAYLIKRSGRGDLVDRIAATRNNASMRELAGDPDLTAWLDSTGLSAAEAARIQPFYGSPPDDRHGVSSSYAITSILLSGTSLATVGVNAIAPSRTAGWAGILAGAASVIAGAAKLDQEGATDDVAKVNMIVGLGALTFGLYRVATPLPSRVSIGPVVTQAGSTPRFGLAVHGSF